MLKDRRTARQATATARQAPKTCTNQHMQQNSTPAVFIKPPLNSAQTSESAVIARHSACTEKPWVAFPMVVDWMMLSLGHAIDRQSQRDWDSTIIMTPIGFVASPIVYSVTTRDQKYAVISNKAGSNTRHTLTHTLTPSCEPACCVISTPHAPALSRPGKSGDGRARRTRCGVTPPRPAACVSPGTHRHSSQAPSRPHALAHNHTHTHTHIHTKHTRGLSGNSFRFNIHKNR